MALKQSTITGTDISVNPAPSALTSFLDSASSGVTEQVKQMSQESKQKTDAEKVQYYNTLREAGYSADEATSRVNKGYKGPWLDRILNRTTPFTPPTNDPYKAAAAAGAAKTKLDLAKADYYKQGGSKRTVIDKMTPNMIQSRIKYLSRIPGASKNPKVQAEMATLTKKLQDLEQNGSSSDSASATGQYKMGQVITHTNGKKYKVVGLSDPNDPDVEPVDDNA